MQNFISIYIANFDIWKLESSCIWIISTPQNFWMKHEDVWIAMHVSVGIKGDATAVNSNKDRKKTKSRHSILWIRGKYFHIKYIFS